MAPALEVVSVSKEPEAHGPKSNNLAWGGILSLRSRRYRRVAGLGARITTMVSIAALALCLCAPRASAQLLTPLGSQFQVNTFTFGHQIDPRVGMEDAGGFAIVWNSTQFQFPASAQDGSGYGVYAQRYAANGDKLGGEFRVNMFTLGHQTLASAEQDRVGVTPRLVVTWTSAAQDGADLGTFVQAYDDGVAGNVDDVQVNTTSAGDQSMSDVFLASGDDELPGGICFAASSSASGSPEDIRCRTGSFASGAAFPANDFRVNAYTTGKQVQPSACDLGGGEFVVAWTDYAQSPANSIVVARKVDVGDGPVGDELQVATDTSIRARSPRVCCGRNGFVVAWVGGGSTSTEASPDGSFQGIVARRFEPTGAPRGSQFVVNQYTTLGQQNVNLACDTAGNFIVVWTGAGSSGVGAYARAFGAGGQPLTDDSLIAVGASGPSVGMSSQSTAVIAWHLQPFNSVDPEVFARRFGVPVIGTTTTTSSTTTTLSGSGGACGDPVDPPAITTGVPRRANAVTASDALRTLQTAVGIAACLPCVCDVNGSGDITASDALIVLRYAVGQPVELDCPACG